MFDEKTAKKDLKRYRRKGPNTSTRLMLEEINPSEIEGKRLMDVGGGVGVISFELFARGLKESIHIDASRGYLSFSEKEAKDRNLDDRMKHLYGDFVDLSVDLPAADLVTLDRAVCCYPDMERMIDASAAKANRLIGLVYPRERWFVKLGMGLGNLWFKFRNIDFRTYLHPPDMIHRQLVKNGFHRRSRNHTLIWEAVVYEVSNEN